MTKGIIAPITAKVKTGMDAQLFAKINSVEFSYYDEDTSDNWTKELINKRSHDMAEMILKMLTKEE